MNDHHEGHHEQSEPGRRTAAGRIMVVGGTANTRSGLRTLLERSQSGFQVAAVTDLSPDLPERAVEIAPDLMIVDAQLPDVAAVLASREFRARLPNATVVLLTAQADWRAVAACSIAGTGHVVKSLNGATLMASLRRAHLHPHRLDTRIAASVHDWYTHRAGDTGNQLRRTESDILALILKGCADDQIARQLGVDSITIRSEIVRVYGAISEDPEFRPIGAFLSRWLN